MACRRAIFTEVELFTRVEAAANQVVGLSGRPTRGQYPLRIIENLVGGGKDLRAKDVAKSALLVRCGN